MFFYYTNSYGVPYEKLWWYGDVLYIDAELGIILYAKDKCLRFVDILNPRIKPGRHFIFTQKVIRAQIIENYYMVQCSDSIYWILRQD